MYGAAFSFALAALVFAPTLEAGFQSEDYTWLALGRFNDSPLPLLRGGILFAYFYRPVGLLLWWATAHTFGDNALLHNAVNLLLHTSNAALLCLVSSRFTGKGFAGWAAGSLFATLPAGTGTASWMSDRFDPLALLFSLLALLAFARTPMRNRHPLFVFAFLLLALLSKEVAFATAGALTLLLACVKASSIRTWFSRSSVPS